MFFKNILHLRIWSYFEANESDKTISEFFFGNILVVVRVCGKHFLWNTQLITLFN